MPLLSLSRASNRCDQHFACIDCIAAYQGVQVERLLQVEALLDRSGGQTPLIDYVASQFEALGYHSWAHRVISSAGVCPLI